MAVRLECDGAPGNLTIAVKLNRFLRPFKSGPLLLIKTLFTPAAAQPGSLFAGAPWPPPKKSPTAAGLEVSNLQKGYVSSITSPAPVSLIFHAASVSRGTNLERAPRSL